MPQTPLPRTPHSPVPFSPITLHILVKYKPMNVPQPPRSEVDELAHRVICIIDLCKDLIIRASRTLAERAGRDPDKEIASANAMLSMVPTLRQAFPATRGTSGNPSNPLKRDHDSMVSGTAVSLVLQILFYIYIAHHPSRLGTFFVLSLPHRLTFLTFRANMSSDTDSSWSSYASSHASSQAPPVKSQQEIEMELIRNKRMAAQSGVKGKYTKRNVRPRFSPQSLWLTSLATLTPLALPEACCPAPEMLFLWHQRNS